MKRSLAGRVAESILLVIGWLISLACCLCYVACSITKDCAYSFMTIWRER